MPFSRVYWVPTSFFVFPTVSKLCNWKNPVIHSVHDTASALGIWNFIKQWDLIFCSLFPSYWVSLLLSVILAKSLKAREEVFSVALSCDNAHDYPDLAGFTEAPALVGLPAKPVTTAFESVEINEQEQSAA